MYKSSLISFTGEQCQHNKGEKKKKQPFNTALSFPEKGKKGNKDRFLTCAPGLGTEEAKVDIQRGVILSACSVLSVYRDAFRQLYLKELLWKPRAGGLLGGERHASSWGF